MRICIVPVLNSFGRQLMNWRPKPVQQGFIDLASPEALELALADLELADPATDRRRPNRLGPGAANHLGWEVRQPDRTHLGRLEPAMANQLQHHLAPVLVLVLADWPGQLALVGKKAPQLLEPHPCGRQQEVRLGLEPVLANTLAEPHRAQSLLEAWALVLGQLAALRQAAFQLLLKQRIAWLQRQLQ